MNKTLKCILIGIVSFFVVFGIIMLFMGIFAYKNMLNEFNQKPAVAQLDTETVSGYKNISVKELADMLKNKDFTMVNVHIPYIGDIEGTDLSIPFNEITNNLDKLPEDKNSKIVLYCQSGSMSEIASEKLVDLGYTNIYNLNGGMIEWQKQGYPLIQI